LQLGNVPILQKRVEAIVDSDSLKGEPMVVNSEASLQDYIQQERTRGYTDDWSIYYDEFVKTLGEGVWGNIKRHLGRTERPLGIVIGFIKFPYVRSRLNQRL